MKKIEKLEKTEVATVLQSSDKQRYKKGEENSVQGGSADWPYLSDARIVDKHFALNKLVRVELMSKKEVKKSAPLDEVVVTATDSFGKVSLDYIGKGLYSAVKPVKSGRQLFEVFNLREWHTIPEEDDDTLYRILVDVNSVSNPRLILFDETILR